jgi:hypothetical protein
MRRTNRTWQILAVVVVLVLSSWPTFAQVSTSFEQSNIQTTPRIRVGQILPERNATVSISTRSSGDELGGAGTTDNSIIQEALQTEEDFVRFFQRGTARTPKIGGTQGRLRISAPLGPNIRLPLFERAGRLEDAELKLGRLYLDLFTLSGSILYSDNVDQSENNRDGEAIAIVRLQGAMVFQITETMRLAAGGTMAWLPFRGEFGFADPLADFTTSLQPLFLTQFEYEVPLGPRTSFLINDNFNVVSGGFGQSRSFDTLQRDADDVVDREGRRSFLQTQSTTDTERRFREGISIHNTTEAGIETLVPTDTRLGAYYQRDHLWFAQGAAGRPSSQDVWSFRARNERENMRFKPEFNFQARHQNNRPGFDKTMLAGATGPISNYLDFSGSAGVLLSGATDQKNFVYRLGLLHRPRELTTQSLTITRNVTFPADQLVTLLSYRLEQVLSPDWVFDLGYERRIFEPISNPNNQVGAKEDQIDARFGVRITTRFRALAGYSYTHSVNRGAGTLRYDNHTYRLELAYAHTDVTESSLIYQFERRLSNRVLDSFDENVVTYSLTRRF